MHKIPLSISQKDIRVYLDGRLSRIARFFGLKPWPSNKELDKLVELSSGLFIYASTVVNFIDDKNTSNPIQQLSTVLSTPYIKLTATSPHRHLDSLYLAVLREAFPDISEDQQIRLQTVLGTNILLFDPLDPENLEVLLGLRANTVRMTLQHLHSIVIVPDSGGGPVRLIHPSSHDFLVDDNRCNDANFFVDARLQHTLLAECCLQVLQGLSPDMCKIGDPSLYNREVVDLPIRIATSVPAHVQYACRHWASHLSRGNIHDEILELLLHFCSNQLLNWLEMMSLLGELEGAITALQLTHEIVKVRHLDFFAKTTNK
jgi:hypothetical protein